MTFPWLFVSKVFRGERSSSPTVGLPPAPIQDGAAWGTTSSAHGSPVLSVTLTLRKRG
ncbi:hypothetical protein Dcar01_01143 [Deinococcus carri]|uniref:Uncharacterized protein n=1 Tax=Deinococcus carri TaxID=1211323 RepID=A0ABP9W511_9DEIO